MKTIVVGQEHVGQTVMSPKSENQYKVVAVVGDLFWGCMENLGVMGSLNSILKCDLGWVLVEPVQKPSERIYQIHDEMASSDPLASRLWLTTAIINYLDEQFDKSQGKE